LEGEANTCSRVGGSSCSGNYNGDGFHGKEPSNSTASLAAQRPQQLAQEVFIPKPVVEPLIEGLKTGAEDTLKPRNGQELLDQMKAERESQYRQFKNEVRQPENAASEAARLGNAWKAEDTFLHNLLRIIPRALEALKDLIGGGAGETTIIPSPPPKMTPQQQCHASSCEAKLLNVLPKDLAYKDG
jgi:hypothetical protein